MPTAVERFSKLPPGAQKIVFDRAGLDVEKFKTLQPGAQEIVLQRLQQNQQPTPTEAPDIQPPEQPEPEEQSFIRNVGQDMSKRWETLKEIHGAKLPGPAKAALAMGQGVAGAMDIGTRGLGSLYKTLVPERVKENVEMALGPSGYPLLGLLSKGAQKWGKYHEKYPEQALLLEGIGNLINVFPASKGAKIAGTAAKGTAKEAVNLPVDIYRMATGSVSPQSVGPKMDALIEDKFMKAVKPSLSSTGKKSTSQEAYRANARTAMEKIWEHKKAVGEDLPESLQDLTKATDEAMGPIFEKYNQIAIDAGESGLKVDVNSIASRLMALAKKKHIMDRHPNLSREVTLKDGTIALRGIIPSLAARYKARGKNPYDIMDAQDAIKQFNVSMDAYHKNPTYEMATTAYTDGIVADEMRKATTKAIDSFAGKGDEWQKLRKEWGALKDVQEDIGKAAAMDLRKDSKGLIDFTDIYSVYAGVGGLLSKSPETIAAAMSASWWKNRMRLGRDPNLKIKKMFKEIDKLKTQGTGPKSRLGKLMYGAGKPTEAVPTGPRLAITGSRQPIIMKERVSQLALPADTRPQRAMPGRTSQGALPGDSRPQRVLTSGRESQGALPSAGGLPLLPMPPRSVAQRYTAGKYPGEFVDPKNFPEERLQGYVSQIEDVMRGREGRNLRKMGEKTDYKPPKYDISKTRQRKFVARFNSMTGEGKQKVLRELAEAEKQIAKQKHGQVPSYKDLPIPKPETGNPVLDLYALSGDVNGATLWDILSPELRQSLISVKQRAKAGVK